MVTMNEKPRASYHKEEWEPGVRERLVLNETRQLEGEKLEELKRFLEKTFGLCPIEGADLEKIFVGLDNPYVAYLPHPNGGDMENPIRKNGVIGGEIRRGFREVRLEVVWARGFAQGNLKELVMSFFGDEAAGRANLAEWKMACDVRKRIKDALEEEFGYPFWEAFEVTPPLKVLYPPWEGIHPKVEKIHRWEGRIFLPEHFPAAIAAIVGQIDRLMEEGEQLRQADLAWRERLADVAGQQA